MTVAEGQETMTDETYNGWSNRETWAVALHINNDEGSYTYARELADRARSEAADWLEEHAGQDSSGPMGATVVTRGRWILGDMLKEWVEDQAEAVYHAPSEATEWARMLCADAGSLWRVEWAEIGEAMLSED